MRQHKIRRRKLGGLIVVLERLIVIVLHVERSSQLITAFGAHRFVFGVVEGVQGQMLHFTVVLFEEEMIGQMVEYHWIGGVDGVCFREHLYALTMGLGLV